MVWETALRASAIAWRASLSTPVIFTLPLSMLTEMPFGSPGIGGIGGIGGVAATGGTRGAGGVPG